MATGKSSIKGEARALILNAAEELFARHGVEAVSLRTINAEAGVSPGVLHYHFGSREVLVTELISRHMGLLMAQREQRLLELSNRPQPELRDIVSVLVEPMAELATASDEEGPRYVQFMARLYADNSPILEEVSDKYRHINALYPQLLARALPGRDPLELQLRLAMANHTMLQTLADLTGRQRTWVQEASHSDESRRGNNSDSVALLVDFITAGIVGC